MSTSVKANPYPYQETQVKFFDAAKGFGITEDECYFSVQTYRNFTQSYRGVRKVVQAAPKYDPLQGETILVLSLAQSQKKGGGQGYRITWCFPEDLLIGSVELWVVLGERNLTETSPPKADNELKVYVQKTLTTKTVFPVFIGSEEGCNQYIGKNTDLKKVRANELAQPDGLCLSQNL